MDGMDGLGLLNRNCTDPLATTSMGVVDVLPLMGSDNMYIGKKMHGGSFVGWFVGWSSGWLHCMGKMEWEKSEIPKYPSHSMKYTSILFPSVFFFNCLIF